MDNVWYNVRKVKIGTPLNKICRNDKTGLYNSNLDFASQVEALEKQLGIESSDEKFENMTADVLKIGAEMFIYLNACPGKLNLPVYTTLENWFQEWRKFYIDLFNGQPVDLIALSLNRMM